MGKSLYIAEKPSVALEFARVLGVNGRRQNGYVEDEKNVVTWCVGHLVTMSYPESYDPALKKWALDALPFIPSEWKYQVIESVKQQFQTVKKLLTREDVETIYVCTDSGREGEYIYRLVRQMAGVKGKDERRVWIDSQTEEEILRGIREAKPLSAYDALSDAAYLRAKEDYLMGINFSRALTLKFGPQIAAVLKSRYAVVSVGRVMTCVLGMVVRREREIRSFVPTPFYRVTASFEKDGTGFEGEWRAVKGSKYFESPLLYKENGFKKKEDAETLVRELEETDPFLGTVLSSEKKTEKKGAPLLFNLAELQNECSRRFKKSPDETLQIAQELYEKKLTTYPRTDARVLSTAVAKEIGRNLGGLKSLPTLGAFASEILEKGAHRGIEKSVYTDDKKITDHYALIPTGQGLRALDGLDPVKRQVYELIVRRFLAIFYPPAIYEKYSLKVGIGKECFFSSFRLLKEPGYLKVLQQSEAESAKKGAKDGGKEETEEMEASGNNALIQLLSALKKGDSLSVKALTIKEGETSAPKRYNSGSLILAMENAGQLIEDEDLRAQIRGSGIGTSATRAEILKKLNSIHYLKTNKKTQIVTPELFGELVYDTVELSMKQLLNPELTASWEKGLSYVADGEITGDEYMTKLSAFVVRRTDAVKQLPGSGALRERFNAVLPYYRK